MKAPTVTDAYAMIRFLRKRAQKGDGEKIKQLEVIIAEARDRAATIAVDSFFPTK